MNYIKGIAEYGMLTKLALKAAFQGFRTSIHHT